MEIRRNIVNCLRFAFRRTTTSHVFILAVVLIMAPLLAIAMGVPMGEPITTKASFLGANVGGFLSICSILMGFSTMLCAFVTNWMRYRNATHYECPRLWFPQSGSTT